MENSNHTAHTANPFSIKFVENQKKQVENLTGAFDKAFTMSQNNLVGTFETAAKIMTKLIQTNMDIATNCFELSIKPTVLFSGEKPSDGKVEQAELFNNQVVALLKMNTANFESILQQFDNMAKSIMPLPERFKKEMDSAVELSINTMRTLIDSYSNVGDQEELAIVEEIKDEAEVINEAEVIAKPEVIAKNEKSKPSDKVVAGISKDVAIAINKKMQDEAAILDTMWGAMDGMDKTQKDDVAKKNGKMGSLKKHSDM